MFQYHLPHSLTTYVYFTTKALKHYVGLEIVELKVNALVSKTSALTYSCSGPLRRKRKKKYFADGWSTGSKT